MPTMLSPHFSYAELTDSDWALRHGVDNTPGPKQLANLTVTAGKMEWVRALFGQPIKVTSGFRNKEVNAGVGGSINPPSAHLDGWAVDFTIPGISNYQVARLIEKSDVRFDQLILEYGWVHISFAPAMRQMVMTKKSKEAPCVNGLWA